VEDFLMLRSDRLVSVAAALALAALPLAACSAPEPPPAPDPAEVARGIHERVIAIDTHDDISVSNFTAERNYSQRLDNQVNIPKMQEGGLDAAFLVVYVGQGELNKEGFDNAYTGAVEKFDAIHRLTEEFAPDQIELALTSDDVRRINAAGKKVALIGVENGYSIGEDLGRIKEFYDRGGRAFSFSHNGHSQLCDSNTGERDGQWAYNGLSDLGKQAVAEANRVGFMIDVSHVSKDSMMQIVQLTKAPIIASHSAARALCDHSRNLDDEQLMALKENGGVIQVVAFNGYVKTPPPDSPERTEAVAKLREEMGIPARGAGRGAAGARGAGGGRGGMSEEQRAEYMKRMEAINEQFPPAPRATVSDFVDHIDYVVKLIGLDHVGISSDFDGGGGVDGWNGADETFNVTLELVNRGYTEDQIAKLWGGNLLRVMDECQKVAAGMQSGS
jgi:membrane dipeptidase